MATTTNFGWETPDDTDLVKDGALAIRTLGSAIDTSLVDLKGGTTGQVLSKTSNTDMDFTWVTSDDANAIQNAIVDAKGDLIAASAADTPARLAVGNNGETLVADSSASTGLRWQTGVNRNFIINGGFDIWQRGTSFTNVTANVYTADRWACGNSSANTFSRQSSGLAGIEYCLRVQRTNGSTSTNDLTTAYNIETVESIPLQGKTVTVSFYARKSSTASSSILAFKWYSGTGTNQNLWNGAYTGAVTILETTVTLTDSWQRFSFTANIASNATQVGFFTNYTPSGTAGAADYVEQTGFQLEYGSVATNFKRAGGTLAGELQAAQRYYQRISNDGGNAYSFLTNYGMATTTGKVRVNYPFKVPMRIAPSTLDYSTLAITNDDGNVYSVSSATLDNTTTSNIASIAANTGSTITQYRPYFIGANNSASAYIGFSAEL